MEDEIRKQLWGRFRLTLRDTAPSESLEPVRVCRRQLGPSQMSQAGKYAAYANVGMDGVSAAQPSLLEKGLTNLTRGFWPAYPFWSQNRLACWDSG